VAAYLTRGWTLPAWGRWLDVSEPPRPADYALVLGGGPDSRPFVAAGLYKRGLAGGVLVADVRPAPDAADLAAPTEAALIRRVLTARGVPAGNVVTLPGEVASTFDEAHALGRFLDAHPGATVAVVTDDYHTRRARRVFRKVLGARATQVHFVATPVDGVSAADWWTTPRGFSSYVGETFKAAYYEVRY
jgi:uncharacterized SAM-binding protein YcdF (DUF218 family)